MIIAISAVKDPVYTRQGCINCLVKLTGVDEEETDWLPFTATPTDEAPHGKELWQALNSGQYGQIAPYTQPEDAVEKARQQKINEINAWRNSMEAANYTFEHNGRKWDYGKSTQMRLEPSVAAAKAGKLPEEFFWTDADNNDVPMDAETLIALSAAAEQAMFTKGLEIHVRQRTMKKEIEALGDAEAILAYKVGMADR